MRAAVERMGQPQDMLEVLAHCRQATALGEAVGVQRDQNAGTNPAYPEQAPQAEQQKDLLPRLMALPCAAVGQGIDDAAEQQRTEEADRGERCVGQRQRDREAALRPEQGQHAAVQSKEAHLETSIRSHRRAFGCAACRRLARGRRGR
jgi:hypothetical protein